MRQRTRLCEFLRVL